MSSAVLRLATRGSELALTQSRHMAALLQQRTGVATELVVVRTVGDRVTDRALEDVGGVGLFTSEVQQAVLRGEADYAVHSLKDLPAEQAAGLARAAVSERADSRDCLLVRETAWDAERGAPSLPPAPVVGTSAARRRMLVRDRFPDARLKLLRGNVPTRIGKLAEGEYDAIVLAMAGIDRLRLDLGELGVRRLPLPHAEWPGAPGQGALALECRAEDSAARAALGTLHAEEDAAAIDVERGLLRRLGGGCSLPLAAHAERLGSGWRLHAVYCPAAPPDAEPHPDVRRVRLEGDDPVRLIERAYAGLTGVGEVAP